MWGMAHAARRVVGAVVLVVVALAGLPAGPSAADYLAAAAAARASQRYDRALAAYAAAEGNAPGDARPTCGKAQVLALQLEWAASAEAYDRCLALDGSAANWLALGDVLAGAAQRDAASAAWQRAERLGSVAAMRRLARADEAAGRLGSAEARWARMPADDVEARAHLGLLALAREDMTAARPDLEWVMRQGGPIARWLDASGVLAALGAPALPPAALGPLGYSLLSLDLPRLALLPLRHAARALPQDGTVLAFLGWTQWVLGDTAAARRDIARAVRLEPKKSFPWFASGTVAASDGRLVAAEQAFRRALARDPANPAVLFALSQVELARGEYTLAAQHLRAAGVADDPGYTLTYLRMVLDRRLAPARAEVLRDANTARGRWPDNAEVQVLAARLYDSLDLPSQAYYTCQRALTLDPTQPGCYVLLGRYAEQAGDFVQAALLLRTALALRPNGPDAAEARALLEPVAAIPV